LHYRHQDDGEHSPKHVEAYVYTDNLQNSYMYIAWYVN